MNAWQDRKLERESMVREQLVSRGIRDERVLAAIRRVPRHVFVSPDLSERAYEDSALPIACGQTISQPYIVAFMTEALIRGNPKRILEIGTGSGYQTAILAELCDKVHTIEWHSKLSQAARNRLGQLDYRNIEFRTGNGREGWPDAAPFDGILITAGAAEIPQVLIDQIDTNGMLIAPIGPRDEQTMVVLRRTKNGVAETATIGCRFVPLLDEKVTLGGQTQ